MQANNNLTEDDKLKCQRMGYILFSLQFIGLFSIISIKKFQKLNTLLYGPRLYYIISFLTFFNILHNFNGARIIFNNYSTEVSEYYSRSREHFISSYNLIFILFYINFIDKNFISNSLSSIISYLFFCFLSIGESWTKDKINILLMLVEWLLITILNYYLELKEKKIFFVKENIKLDLKMRKDLIDHIKSGIIVLNENFVDFNTKAKDMLNLSSDFKSDYQKIQKFIIGGFQEMNENLDNNLKVLFKEEIGDSNEDIIKIIILNIKENYNFKEFTYIGTKILFNEKYDYEKEENNLGLVRPEYFTIRIKMRFNTFNKGLEIYLNDISSIVEMQDLNASNKYKKMFLNKFSHEFKNPLLNIIGMIERIKGKFNKYIGSIQSIGKRTDSKERDKEFNTEKYSLTIKNKLKKAVSPKKFQSMNSNFSSSDHSVSSSNILRRDFTNPFFDNERQIGIYPYFNVMELNEDYRDLTNMKNLSKYMISLIGDFDFISNTNFNNLQSCVNENKMIEISQFKLNKLIKNCLKIFETRAELNDKNLNFTYELEEDIIMMNSDYRRINQILLNLLSNAYKFTNSGEICIKVHKDLYNKNLLNFMVKDSGTGFNMENMKTYNKDSSMDIIKNFNRTNIFQSNKHVTNSVSYNKGNNENNIYGIGLGLRIVKVLVSILGENFEINTKERGGTIVKFSLFMDYSNKQIKNQIISFDLFNRKNKFRLNNSQIAALKKLHTSNCKNDIIQEVIKLNSPVKTPVLFKKCRTERKSISMFFKKEDETKSEIETISKEIKMPNPFSLTREESSISKNLKLSIMASQDIIIENSSRDESNLSSTFLLQNPSFNIDEVNKLKNFNTDENSNNKSDTFIEKSSTRSYKNSQQSQNCNKNSKSINGGETTNLDQNQIEETNLITFPSNISEGIKMNNYQISQCTQNGQEIPNNNYNESTNFVINISPEGDPSGLGSCSISPNHKNDKSSLLKSTYLSNANLQIAKSFKEPILKPKFTIINENHLEAPSFNDSNFPMNPTTRILVVDDEKLIRQSEVKIIQKYFKKIDRQVEIIECNDGVECLYQLFKGIQNGTQFDYIITDETMNFMRGSLMAQTVKSLTSDNVLYSIKIFMITSYESSSIIERFGNIVDGIVTKPLTPENIKRIFD
jgi:signal transduction histidine kinase